MLITNMMARGGIAWPIYGSVVSWPLELALAIQATACCRTRELRGQLAAGGLLKVPKLVLASSINAIGMAYSNENVPPLYFPVDEEHPTRAEDSYSLSKWVGEQVADGFARRRPVQIASFRFHGLWDTRAEMGR